ncbi:MAG: hypothetical protein NTW21_34845, partial [Verrucomicrobia bacterium]|nr:hypothetical protein [Verrucomicrobiota bacterium]
MKTSFKLTHLTCHIVLVARSPFISGVCSLAVMLATSASLTSCGRAPGSVSHKLSDEAARAGKLLDSGSCSAAAQVLDESLAKSKTDAGMLCQYARCLILARDPAYPNFIQSPLFADGEYYWACGVSQRAVTLAAELDPDCKPYLADLIFQAFEKRTKTVFDEGRGCIGTPRDLLLPESGQFRRFSGIELSMINICWDAIKLDPATAKIWAPRYKDLMQIAVKRGKVASAMMLGNLYGDM